MSIAEPSPRLLSLPTVSLRVLTAGVQQNESAYIAHMLAEAGHHVFTHSVTIEAVVHTAWLPSPETACRSLRRIRSADWGRFTHDHMALLFHTTTRAAESLRRAGGIGSIVTVTGLDTILLRINKVRLLPTPVPESADVSAAPIRLESVLPELIDPASSIGSGGIFTAHTSFPAPVR